MAKTDAERSREYRRRKKEEKLKNNIKKPPKSATERVREFRARRKKLMDQQNQNNSSNLNNNATGVPNIADQDIAQNYIKVDLPSRNKETGEPFAQELKVDLPSRTHDVVDLVVTIVKEEIESDFDENADDAGLLIPIVKLEYESDVDGNTERNPERRADSMIHKEPDDDIPRTTKKGLSRNKEGVSYSVKKQAKIKETEKSPDLPFKLEKDQLNCPLCHNNFPNFVSLNTHMNEHYPNHTCNNCGKAFASKSRLKGHLRTHQVGVFPCRYCDAVFDKFIQRQNHVSKTHKSGGGISCPKCNVPLSSFYARKKHLAEVHNEELKKYKCKECLQRYITPGHLSNHVRRDHLNERNHKCTKCDQAFYSSNCLKMHMIKHDGEKIHSCDVCHRSYTRQKTLKEHMRIHDGDKRFVCPVCERAFTQKSKLKGHLKVHK